MDRVTPVILDKEVHKVLEVIMEAHWEKAESGRRRKYYTITASGKKALDKKRSEWSEFSVGVNGILGLPTHGMA